MTTERVAPDRLSEAMSLENITISLSLGCNQGCRHCWVSAGAAGPDELSDAEIENLLVEATTLGAKHVKFTGGEPLLRKGLLKLVRRAHALGYRISLETNGTALSSANIARMRQFFDRLHLYVSLDGATAETHDSFRKQAGAFHRTVGNLRALRAADGYFTVHTVVRRDNLGEIPDVFRLAKSLGASQLKLILSVHQLGRGAAMQDEAVTPDELFALLQELPPQRLWDYAWDPARSRDTVLMTTLPPAFQPAGATVTCGWSKSFVAVLANGDVALCHGVYELDEAKAGNVRERSLADLWLNSDLFTTTREWGIHDLDGVCGNCQVAEACRGLCRASAVARYRDLRAPYPLCQTMYDAGRFPPEMIRDAGVDAGYRLAAQTAPPVHRTLLPLTVTSHVAGKSAS